MNYKSVASLNHDLKHWLGRLPRDVELVVGVPRSGLLVANLIGLHANLPVTDVEGLIAGRVFGAGQRYGDRDLSTFLRSPRNVFVVDDSLASGQSLAQARRTIDAASLPHRVRYGAAYVEPGTERMVDYYCELVASPRVFEWNIMHHAFLGNCCLDIDGVLCVDPTSDENDDGPRYCEFLRSAKPLMVPTVPLGWLVTCRLEKYRAQTEAWLAQHQIEYGKLVMLDLPDRAARVRANAHAAYKAAVYKETGADLFIESDPRQAREIAALSQWSVFCTETGEMLNPGVDRFAERASKMSEEIEQVVPPGARFILVDDGQLLGSYVRANERILPFLEHQGVFWGAPADDATAVRELERMRREQAVGFIAFAWPAFWWLEHYAGFARHLRERYHRMTCNERAIIYDLR
jgi:orotate phosphoribosyltransferase